MYRQCGNLESKLLWLPFACLAQSMQPLPVRQIFLWTDRTAALQWLITFTKQPIFFADPVCEILECRRTYHWNNVPTTGNPADAGTTKPAAEVLRSSSRYIGPDILRWKQWHFESHNYFFIRLNGIALDKVTLSTDCTITNNPELPIKWSNYSRLRKGVPLLSSVWRASTGQKFF